MDRDRERMNPSFTSKYIFYKNLKKKNSWVLMNCDVVQNKDSQKKTC